LELLAISHHHLYLSPHIEQTKELRQQNHLQHLIHNDHRPQRANQQMAHMNNDRASRISPNKRDINNSPSKPTIPINHRLKSSSLRAGSDTTANPPPALHGINPSTNSRPK
jgi:hypothetical protein